MPALIPGLRYLPDYLDQGTHDRLWAAADRERWLRSADRGVQIYGYSYDHHKRCAYRIGDLPVWAADMATRLWQDGLMPCVPEQMVVNDYPPGVGIFEHVDAELFGDTVVSLSLGSTCVMQFQDKESDRREELLLEPRSAIVLAGEARTRWTHQIPGRHFDLWLGQELQRARRISVTFRNTQESAVSRG